MSVRANIDLAPIEARLARATEGPWAYEHCGEGLYCIGLTHPPVNGRIEDVYNEDRREYEEKPDVVEGVAELSRENAGDDARFIAHARTDVPDLLAELRRLVALHAERDEAERTHLSAYRGACARRERAEEERDALRAEVNMLRGVGCDELDGDDVRGPCGACLKCARRERDAALSLLSAAARGDLTWCETCGNRLALRSWRETSCDVCDQCFAEGVAEARAEGEPVDEDACPDLPYGAALRAAMYGVA